MGTPIPAPPGLPLLGNINDVDPENSIASLMHLAELYGPIYKLNLGGHERIIIASHELLDQICDERRFSKAVVGPLEQIRNGVHDGLFTAYPEEHNWAVAHRVLMPAFGPIMIRSMFDEMHDIATQLVSKWARFGPDHRINVTEDFTRLTLDSIALCAMDTRFNSFYKEDLHPFVHAMVGFLQESGLRARRPQFANYFMRQSQQQYDNDIKLMRSVAEEVVAERRAHPSDKKDLLNAMINGRDPKAGEGLTDATIYNNMITFLIAGHETTSGLLSFLFMYLVKNPATYQEAQKEVDAVIGKGPVTVEHMSKLPYLTACLRETLRLQPTGPAFTIKPLANTKDWPVYLGKNKYEIKPGQALVALLPAIHRDPAVYGNDAEAFRPERMLNEHFEKLPKNAWKPFGNGVRACIGRPFAWQESLLTTALLLQNFSFRLDDPSYQLSIKQTLTIKPKDLFMHATLRDGIDSIHLEKSLFSAGSQPALVASKDKKIENLALSSKPKKPMSIFYGSNTGTCESLAQTLANTASSHGYGAQVATLDSATNNIPRDQPVIIITASYEGEPPDNAIHFSEWLRKLEGSELKGVQYGVFGCGHRDWQATFQKVPILTDRLLEARGGKRVAERGYADVAAGDMFNDFDKWEDQILWPSIRKDFGDNDANSEEFSGLDVEITASARSSKLHQDVREAIVTNIKVLTMEGEPPKRHIDIKLPTDMTYKAGDYLAVLPLNQAPTIRRVLQRFGLAWDAKMTIKPGQNTVLPVGEPISVFDLLAAYVELSQPATLKMGLDDTTQQELKALCGDSFTAEITAKRVSPLDLLERFPAIRVPFGDFLSMLPPLRIRQYSISSSPLAEPTSCTLTYSVLDQEAHAGGKRFLGVASNYLSMLEKGDRIQVAVKASHQAFHPPLDIANVPLVMACAGTGLAPFRGFVQERAKQIEAGRQLAPALLFVGCKYHDRDRLYKEEFDEWGRVGAVDVRYAFSKEAQKSEGCKYVQDRLWKDRKDATELFDAGARVYVCGSRVIGEGVKTVAKKIYMAAAEERCKPKTDEEAEAWFRKIRNERYASDVFA
ncbi:MAG: hypothetical protein M1830_007702 [Pleopsidium flavum]|nr:MAG: hypothetical protein M1830_007702 [Pleopsidium flavum]